MSNEVLGTMEDIGNISVEVPELNTLSITEIQQKIKILSETDDQQQIKPMMADLKRALKENPAACSLLQPEDIGIAVAKLRLITNTQIIDTLTPQKKERKSAAKVALTQEEMDNLTAEDLM